VERIAAKAMLVSLQSGYSAGLNLQLSSNNGKPHQGGLCFGDLGGPVLYGTTVMAVNSFVLNGNCAGSGFSYCVDQPDILAWIKSFLQRQLRAERGPTPRSAPALCRLPDH
jgi:hypothetical protein